MSVKRLTHILALSAALLLSGCAYNFVRPAPQALTLGQSHYSDVVKLLGEPVYKNDDVSINEEKIKTVDYYNYRFPKTVISSSPHRYLHCSFFNDVLVGMEYNSSYQEDSTWFDDSKAFSLVIGASTRESVIAALGQPSGEIVYPLVRDKNGRGLVYWYTLYYPEFFTYVTEAHRLIVFLNDKGIVTDLSYKASDGKEQFPGHVTSWLSEQQFPLSFISY
jgi:hypothetical protein